jgi:hypothetical protein
LSHIVEAHYRQSSLCVWRPLTHREDTRDIASVGPVKSS